MKVDVNTRTEDRILANALRHFCDFGYNGTSVREITASSEVTKPTLYYYFKNKEELFTKLAKTCFDLVLSNMNQVVTDGTDFEATVTALFECLNTVFAKNPEAIKFIHIIAVAPQRGAPNVGIQEFTTQVDQHLRGIVRKAIKNGQCLEAKADTAHVLLSALLGLYTKSILTSGAHTSTDKKAVETVLSAVVYCANNPACLPK